MMLDGLGMLMSDAVNPGELKLATGLHPDSCQFPLLDGDEYNAVGNQMVHSAKNPQPPEYRCQRVGKGMKGEKRSG
jgi:hypothetical protein